MYTQLDLAATMSSVGPEVTIRTVPSGDNLEPKVDEIDVRQGTFVNISINKLNGTVVAGGSVLTDGGAATLSNKSLDDMTTKFVDTTDSTIVAKIDAAGSTGTAATLRFAQSADRIYTVPDSGADCEVVTAAGAQTISGAKTFADLHATSLNGDSIAGGLVSADGAAALSNKSLDDTTTRFIDSADDTVWIELDAAGSTGTGSTLRFTQNTDRVYTVPDSGADCEVVTAAGAQMVGGAKTFTAGLHITGGALTLEGRAEIHTSTAQITTTDATTTTLFTLPTAADTVYMFSARAMCSGASGTAVYQRNVKVVNRGGAITMGAPVFVWEDVDTGFAATSVSFAPSGTNVLVQVNGLAATNLKWSGQIEILAQTV